MILLFRYQQQSHDTESLLPALLLIYVQLARDYSAPSAELASSGKRRHSYFFFPWSPPSDPANHMSTDYSPKEGMRSFLLEWHRLNSAQGNHETAPQGFRKET